MVAREANFYLTEGDRAILSQWIKGHNTPQQIVLRSKIILLLGHRLPAVEIANKLSVNRHTCRLWRGKFMEHGPKGLWDISSGRGRKPNRIIAKKIIKATLQCKPEGQTHWSTRSMAKAQGVSKDTVNRIWQMNNIKPHLHKTFKLSRDPKFIQKLTDV